MSKKMLIITGAVVAVAVVGFLLFRPDKLFVDDVADESLEDAFATPAAAAGEASSPPTTGAPTTTTAPPTTAPPDTGEGEADPTSTTSTTTTTVPPTTTTAAPAEPVVFSTGSFFGIDHRASGTATIYEQDGRYVLRFEDDTDIQNGPDLYVWVTEGTDWADPAEGYLDLGTLKGNVGGQNYELPPEFDPEVHRNVLIWCLRFQVPFAAAELG